MMGTKYSNKVCKLCWMFTIVYNNNNLTNCLILFYTFIPGDVRLPFRYHVNEIISQYLHYLNEDQQSHKPLIALASTQAKIQTCKQPIQQIIRYIFNTHTFSTTTATTTTVV